MTTPSALRELAIKNREIETKQKAAAFAEVAKHVMLGRGNLGTMVHAAQSARVNERVLEGIKAAVNAGTLSDGTFAGPLAYQELSDAFLLSLKNFGVFDAALPFAVDVPLNMQVAITTTGVSGACTPEGQVKLVSRISLAAQALTPRKAVAIIATTSELLRAGGAKALKLFQAELQPRGGQRNRSRFPQCDRNRHYANAIGGVERTGDCFRHGCIARRVECRCRIESFYRDESGDAKHFAIQIGTTGERAFPGLTISGGDYAGATVIPTDALSGSIVGFDASQIAMGSTGVELDASNEASIQMADVPDLPPSVVTNYSSLYQLNMTGLRATRYYGCERLRTSAVSVISNVNWGTGNSPA